MEDPIISALWDVFHEARKNGHIDVMGRILEIVRVYPRDVSSLLPLLHFGAAEALGYADEAREVAEECHEQAKELFGQGELADGDGDPAPDEET